MPPQPSVHPDRQGDEATRRAIEVGRDPNEVVPELWHLLGNCATDIATRLEIEQSCELSCRERHELSRVLGTGHYLGPFVDRFESRFACCRARSAAARPFHQLAG